MLFRTAFSLASPAGKGGRLSILIFHRVLPIPDPLLQDEPCVNRFEEMMRWVVEWFNVLPLEQAVELLRRGQLPARAASITFDDGYADNLTHATPILKKYGLHATFFIATGFLDGGRMWNDTIIESIRNSSLLKLDFNYLGVGDLPIRTINEKRIAIESLLKAVKHQSLNERRDAVERIREECGGNNLPDNLMLSSKQLRELNEQGMGIGAHTVSHPILAKLSDDEARQEIADSRDFLEELLKHRIPLFAYPNGKFKKDYTQIHANLVRSLGFDAAVSTDWGTSKSTTNLYHMPRFTPWNKHKWSFCIRLLENYRISV